LPLQNNVVFIDTNIFVYAYEASEPQENRIAQSLLKECAADKTVKISAQVLNEFYVTMKRLHFSNQQIAQFITEIVDACSVSALSLATVERCLLLSEKYGYSWWDSLILATALENNCETVYSEDMQDGQVIEESLAIKNPFVLLTR
jgi:predicted nucleic acid-binding protein